MKSLPKKDLSSWDVINPDPINLDVMTFNYNLTNFHFLDGADIDGSFPIIDIGYNNFVFQIIGLNLTLAFDYEYVSDPPIFADIGCATIGVSDFYLNLTDYIEIIDYKAETVITDIYTGTVGPQPDVTIDGLSDFSQVLTTSANFIKLSVLNRLASLINTEIFT